MSTSGPLAANITLFKSLGYNPMKELTPISLFAVLPNVIVINSKMPPKTLTELIAYAKAHPKELNYGTVGVGSSQHIAAVYFEQITGVELTHVPYRNIAQYTPDFLAGQVPLGFQLLPNVLGILKSGDARALARARIAAICMQVLTLPNMLAGITTPACVAPRRSIVTASSRVMMTIATHASRRFSETSESSAAMINSLSASGSISLPNVVIDPRARARRPSRTRS